MRSSYASRRGIRALMVGGLAAISFALMVSPSSAIDAANPAAAKCRQTCPKLLQAILCRVPRTVCRELWPYVCALRPSERPR